MGMVTSCMFRAEEYGCISIDRTIRLLPCTMYADQAVDAATTCATKPCYAAKGAVCDANPASPEERIIWDPRSP